MSSPVDPEAAAAEESALRQFVREDWTLFAVGLSFTCVRTYARVKQVGFKGLQADDYLVWIGMLFYTAETSLAYSVGAIARGLANNDVCQPAISNRVVWVYGSLNVATDLYLISIPVPMLWQSSLKPMKKVGFIALFSGGLFVIVCALLRATFIVTDPINGAQLAGSWAVRETFVAVITTNLPMVFPFIKSLLTPILSTLVQSMRGSSGEGSADKTPKNFRTWGGGGKQSWRGRGPRTPNPITDFTFGGSEEHILDQGQVRMQDLNTGSSKTAITRDGSDDGNKIRKDVELAVTSAPGGEENRQHQDQGSFVYAGPPARTTSQISHMPR